MSPTVVRSDNGDPYLLWGAGEPTGHAVYMAKLKPNMVELAEPVREISVKIHTACGLEYYESPILFKYNDLWYLTYVAFNNRNGHNCNFSDADLKGSYIRYATSKSMFGPFDQDIRTLIFPGAGGVENVHQGVCQYQGKWYVAYHMPHLPSSGSSHRQAAVTRLRIRPDGSLVPIYPDKDSGVGTHGVSLLTLDAFAHKREAAEFHGRANADTEKAVMGEYQLKMKDGSYLRFNGMDFGNGASGYRVEVSSENRALTNGRLEFRLDNPAGRIIGQANIAYTKGKTNYVILAGPVSSEARSIHDVFLVAKGKGGDEEGHLFNIAWFTLTRDSNAKKK